jgi:hypothetical protein
MISRTTTNVCEDAGKNVPSYTTSGIVSWYNHYGKQYGGFLKT